MCPIKKAEMEFQYNSLTLSLNKTTVNASGLYYAAWPHTFNTKESLILSFRTIFNTQPG